MAKRSRMSNTAPKQDREHIEKLLDEALEQTFPASDPVAIIQPAPETPSELSQEGVMPAWVVKATWLEDEGEASEEWEVTAASAEEAIEQVRPRFRLPPHHVEARRVAPE